MMKEDDLEDTKRQARLAAIEEVHALCPDFIANRKPLAITSALIEDFIKSTSHIKVEVAFRLIPFAGYVKSDFGFDGFSQVYRYLTETEEKDTLAGFYGSWLALGVQELADSVNNSLEERMKISCRLKEILEQAGGPEDSIDQDSNYVHLWADYYYNHPERKRDSDHLLHATKYYQFSVNQKIEDDEIDAYALCQLANCYLQLEDFQNAAKYYRLVNLSELEESGDISQKAVLSGLAICNSKDN